MADKIKEYWSDDIVVTYDVGRCTHAAECIRGLPSVFDAGRRPWVQPANARAHQVAEVVLRCPTGALHFQRKDGGPAESPAGVNTVTLRGGGPLYLRGDIELRLPDGSVVHDTRMALCRCGASQNKPFCDNSHRLMGFDASGQIGENKLRLVDTLDTGGKLVITPTANGSLRIEGPVTLVSADGQTIVEGNRGFLCRCGGSQNKPFCDSTHRSIGFQAEGL